MTAILAISQVFLFIFLSIILSSCSFVSNKILIKPVAQVEKFQLTTQDFSKELANRLKNLDALSAKDPKIIHVYKEQIINEFIVSSFVNLWLAENKLSLSAANINKEISTLIATYPSDAVFRELLADSELSYAEWVVKTEDTLKKKMVLSIITQKLPSITEEELLSYYNSNRTKYEQIDSVLLSHILINDLNEAAIVKKLVARQNFTVVAKKYSSAYNEESKDLYGWIEKGYSPSLEIAFKTRLGEPFGPITLSDGTHLFKVIERRLYKIKSFSLVRSQILSEIQALRETAKFTAWLDEQIKKYSVKKNSNMIASIRAETR